MSSMTSFKFRSTAANFVLSLLFGGSLIFLIAMVIWVRGFLWNLYWWPFIGGVLLVAVLAPFFIVTTYRVIFVSSLTCSLISASAFGISFFIISEEAKIPPIPVLTVNSDYPTRDKPQSKLWFAHGSWWAWFPDGDGSSIWRRANDGWKRETSLDDWLNALPGRADVWSETNGVRAVLVAEDQLSIAGLIYEPRTGGYKPDGDPFIWAIPDADIEEPIESATIARDGNGIWWIVYDFQRSIWVRHSEDVSGSQWGNPIKLGGPVAVDDIGVIFTAPGYIGVMWAHQSGGDEEEIYFRRHLDRSPPEQWEDVETIERGYGAAEDHFNAAVGANGHVYVVTKDDKNVIDQPQLVLRDLYPDGSWKNYPYANRTELVMPTRPIALLGGDPLHLYLVHSLYPQGGSPRGEDFIGYRRTDLTLSQIDNGDRILIPPRKGLNIRNATSTKNILPFDEPWIVLASDKYGNVYEGVLENRTSD